MTVQNQDRCQPEVDEHEAPGLPPLPEGVSLIREYTARCEKRIVPSDEQIPYNPVQDRQSSPKRRN